MRFAYYGGITLLTTMSSKRQDRVDIVGKAVRNLIRLEKDIDNVLNFEKFSRNSSAPMPTLTKRKSAGTKKPMHRRTHT